MKKWFYAAAILSASCAWAGDRGGNSGAPQKMDRSAPYWHSSETAPWYDSYGRLRHGYKDAPMKSHPAGKEPYYYSSDNSTWYDSQGRLRRGPQATDTTTYKPGTEPYWHYSDNSAWYDSYGNLRYGPKGVPADEYRKGLGK